MEAARTLGVSYRRPFLETDTTIRCFCLLKDFILLSKTQILDVGTTRPPRPDNERPRPPPNDPTVVVQHTVSSKGFENAPFYIRNKRPTVEIDNVSEMSSISKVPARPPPNIGNYLGKTQHMERAKSSQNQPEVSVAGGPGETKTFIPAGYFKYAGYISKDANAQVQQDRSFYDSQKFKYRFNEELSTLQPRTPSVRATEPALPPKLKNHAAGQPSDWAGSPIPGQVKHWAYQTTNYLKSSAAAQLHKTEDLSRVGSGYAKKRIIGDAGSVNRDTLPKIDSTNFGGPQDDRASTLTKDKLRKFNDINGYEHGPAAAEADDQEALDEVRDQVVDLPGSPTKGRNNPDT